MEWAERLEVAEEAAREAGALAMRKLADLEHLTIEKKGRQDYVSAADREVEKLLKERLLGRFPEDSFLGEEYGGDEDGGVWVVDPIDGTGNFVRGIPLFGISIAYWLRGEAVVGVVLDPCHDELYVAHKGHGATRNGRPLAVRQVSNLDDAVVTLGFSSSNDADALLGVTRVLMERGAEFRRFGAAVLGMVWIAEGRTDAFFHLRLSAWDALAAALIVREAGGCTSPAFGIGELTKRAPILACTAALKDELSAITGLPL